MRNRTEKTWNELLCLLGEMQHVFQEFLFLLSEEERVLIGMDRQGIADITEKKEQVLDGMGRYEQQVMASLRDLAGPEYQEGLGKWLKSSTQSQAVSASAIFHELVGLGRKIQEQGKKNAVIIRRTQHVVGEAINLIYSGLGAGPVYQESGALQFSSVLSSVHLHG